MPLLTTPTGRFCYFHTNITIAPSQPPTITQGTFNFYNSGTTSAQPYVTFTSTDATSYTWSLFQSQSFSGKYMSLASGSGGTPTGTIVYTGTTLVDGWYFFIVSVSNSIGPTASYSTSKIQNNLGGV